MEDKKYDYDIVFSFVGEDRDIVEKLAKALKITAEYYEQKSKENGN